jgi:hypothetical protein
MTAVTCQTEGCTNEGVPIEVDLTWVDEDGETHEIETVVCGPCGRQITEIAPS